MNFVRTSCCIMLLAAALNASAGQSGPMVVPLPQRITHGAGGLALGGDRSLSLQMFTARDTSLSIALSEINEMLRMKYGRGFDAKEKRLLMIGIPSENIEFVRICARRGMRLDTARGSEAYVLSVDASGIILSGASPAGLFYGLQTLKQILRSADRSLPSVRIEDFPSYRYRGVMDDVSRGPIPTLEYVKYQIRRLAELKINLFMQYTEHIVRTKSHPEFAPPDGSYTIEELKELADYASLYHVRFAGNFQSFGHFNAVLAAPRYAHLGESGTLLSPMLAESYSFLDDIYREMIPAFNAPFFSVNCDETFDLGKGASRPLVDSIGYDGVYFQHIMKLHALIAPYKTRMMLWGDILLKYPELIGRIPNDVVIGTWTYDVLDSYDEYIAPFAKAGLDVFVVPGVLNSNRLFPGYDQAIGNIRGFALGGRMHHALGIMTTVWDDGGSAFFSNDWPAVSYGAEQGWNPNTRPVGEYEHRLMRGIYGLRDENFMQSIHTLGRLRSLGPTDDLTDKILFEPVIPARGSMRKVNLDEWDSVERIADSARALLEQTHFLVHDRDRRSVVFTARLYGFLARKRSSLMRASRLYREAERIVQADAPRARTCLVNAIAVIDSVHEEQQAVRAGYERMWLEENHTYALERITSRFDDELAALTEIDTLLFSSLRALDSGSPILPIAAVRLDLEQLSGQYFTEWLMTNPIAIADDNAASGTDYLAGMGGERLASPKVTQEFRYDTSTVRWRRTASAAIDRVDLAHQFPEFTRNGVAYAFASIDAPDAMTVTARAVCDGGLVVFCNGARVSETLRADSLDAGASTYPLILHKGKNTIMIKALRSGSRWGFSFMLEGREIRHRKNRYTIVR